MRRIETRARPPTGELALKESVHPLVEFPARPRDLRLRDLAHPRRLHQAVDLARAHPVRYAACTTATNACSDAFLDSRNDGKQVPGPQQQDRKLHRSDARPELALTVPLALMDSLESAIAKPSSAALSRLQLHQPLPDVLAELSQEISVGVLLSKLQQCHFVVGHRGVPQQAGRLATITLRRPGVAAHPPPRVTPLSGTLPAEIACPQSVYRSARIQ